MKFVRIVGNIIVGLALAGALVFIVFAHLSQRVRPMPKSSAFEQVDFEPGAGKRK